MLRHPNPTTRAPGSLSHCARLIVVSMLLAGGVGGCVVAGAIADRLSGNPADKAAYDVGKDTVVVIVEASTATGLTQETEDRIALLISHELGDHKVNVVSPAKLLELRSARVDSYRQIEPAQRGKLVGAQQVILLRLTRFEEHRVIGGEAGATLDGKVCVLDAATGNPRWPDAAGLPITYSTATGSQDLPVDGLAQQVAKLFYSRE